MNVLLCGASGFIGSAIARALRAAGHRLIEPPGPPMDFSRDLEATAWLPRLAQAEAVINAVGALRDSPARPLEALHHRAPAALFEACAQCGVRRIIQISALGIEGNATPYARSKLAGDAALMALQRQGRLDATILRPSIVFGPAGLSSRLFMRLAALPLLPLPAEAFQGRVQPITASDLAQTCLALLSSRGPELLELVGPQALSLADFLAELRHQQGRRPALRIKLPPAWSRWSAQLGDRLPWQTWGSATLALMRSDNTAPVWPVEEALGRQLTPLARFVADEWRQPPSSARALPPAPLRPR